MKINNTFLIAKCNSFFSILSLTCKIIVSLLSLHCATFLLSFWEFSHCHLLDLFTLLPIPDSQRPHQEKVPSLVTHLCWYLMTLIHYLQPASPLWAPHIYCCHRQQLLDTTKTLKFDIKNNNNNRKITNFFLINRIHCMQSLAHD